MAKLKRTVVKEEVETPTISKRKRKISSSEDDTTGFEAQGKCPDSPPLSKIYNSACRNNKPAELFRKDLISAMKLPDSEQLNPEDYWCVTDSWKQEWERGVQVPVNSKNVPIPRIIDIGKQFDLGHFKLPKKLVRLSEDEFFSSDIHALSTVVKDAEKVCHYDMDDLDCSWLECYNEERQDVGLQPIDEMTIELAIENFETQCFNRFQEAFKTQEGLGIEYDEDVTCDVCRTPECEEGNEMVFCDVCNICVHQACYGITTIPDGSWVCRTCAANIQPTCVLCPNKGGAMKSTSGDSWAHVSCALWVPEVGIVDPEKMEPIAKISQIPASRWSLICTLCRERSGACIQCCVKQCKVAYHVTCAFEHGLEMKGIIDESREDEGVKLKSYCPKHSNNNKEIVTEGVFYKAKNVIKKGVKQNGKISDLDKQNAKLQKIRTMETEFFKYVDLKETRKLHNLDADVVSFIYNYWRLKRSSNFNKPLIPTKIDEAALLGKHPEDSLYARMKRFVHLRQDLERVRNLCYMVSRREKLRRSFFKTKEEIFLKLVEALKCKKGGLKDFESLLKSSEGESVYDQMYSRKNYKALEKPPFQKDDEKNKSQQRLPNPYAKRYLSGTRSRRFTSTNSMSECSETSKSSEQEQITDISPENENNKEVPETEEIKSSEKVIEPKIKEISPSEVDKSPKTKSASKDLSEKIVDYTERQTRHMTHLMPKNEDIKPPEKDLLFEDIIADKIPKSEPLDNVKNSPSQSDKENIVSTSKRGRKSKNQMDIKSVDLSKAIENLSIKAEVETTDCLKVKDNIVTPETRLDGGRYLMRSRNRSISESQTSPCPFSGKISPISKQTFNHISDPVSLNDHKESSSADDEPDTECSGKKSKDKKLSSKVKFRKKRRIRQCLFIKTEEDDNDKVKDQNKKRSLKDSESSDFDDIEEMDIEDKKELRHLTITPTTEFKMTLRQGKLLWSPRKLALRNSDRLLNNDLRFRSFSTLSSDTNDDVINLDDEDSQILSPECDTNTHRVNNRDLTSSPRLVLRLKKDPERQRWEKEPVPLDSLVFRVVRNDWESPPHHKTLKSEIDDCELLDDFDHNNSGHRYMMRKRSKPTTPS